MKPLIFSLFLFGAFNATSQQFEMQLSELPVKNGLIYKNQGQTGSMYTQVDGVYITATNDSCFATEDGKVVSTFDLGGEFAILSRPNDNKFVTYSNLQQLGVKRGETIKKGMFIGLLKHEDDQYQLLYIHSNNKGKALPHDELLAYLKDNTSIQK